MKLFATIGLAALLPMGDCKAQSARVGLGIHIGLPSMKVHVHRRESQERVRRTQRAHVVPTRRSARQGRWVLQRTRHWVPAVYGYRRGLCGRRVRYLVRAGHYEIREERIWVPARRQVHRGHRRGIVRQRQIHRPQPEVADPPRRSQSRQPVTPKKRQRQVHRPQSVPGGRRGRASARVGVLYS